METILSIDPWTWAAFVAAGVGENVRLWNVESGAIVAEAELPGVLALSGDATVAVTGDGVGRLRIWPIPETG